MEISDFNDFGDLLASYGPVKRRKALREAARYLMLSNRKRLRLNVEPSGKSMTARQNGTGQRMFKKLGKSMLSKESSDKTDIGYFGSSGRLATNHQLGKTLKRNLSNDRIMMIDLPVRALLGLSNEDRLSVEKIFLKHMQGP